MHDTAILRPRRLPVYLLIGCSRSMSGEPIEAVRMGFRALLSDLQQDPQALETIWLSVITFANSATQVVPLTEIALFEEPRLEVGGDGRSLGEALTILRKCVEVEVWGGSETQKGDWKPNVFLLIDGPPTDRWEPEASKVKTAGTCNIIACLAGPGADSNMFRQLTDVVIQLKDMTTGSLGSFMRWVSPTVT